MHKAFKIILAALVGGISLGLGYYLIDSEKLTLANGKVLGVIPQPDSNEYHQHDIGVGILLFAFGAVGAGGIALLTRKIGLSTVANAAAAATPAASPVK